MIFFSASVASTLQFFTFPLELIGLTLATIEVRFPMLAGQLANRVLAVVEENEREAGNWKRVLKTRDAIIALLGIAVLVIVIFTTGKAWTAILGFLLVAVVTSASYLIAVKWVPGRTIGTLGLIVAGFGVLGEFYQVVTQLVL